FFGQRNIYGRRLGLRLQLDIQYQDGSIDRITTDGAWKTASGPVLSSDIYGGESYDARSERTGWAGPGFDDHDWSPVSVLEQPATTLVAAMSPPVRRVRTLRPIEIRRLPSGGTLFDLRQNFTRWGPLVGGGTARATVTPRPAQGRRPP